jgi:hypothetical protein
MGDCFSSYAATGSFITKPWHERIIAISLSVRGWQQSSSNPAGKT